MPGREKDRTMRTVSSPLTRVWVEWGIAYGTVPSYIRKTMDSSNSEKGLDTMLVFRRHNLWQKKRIDKCLWQFVVDLRRAWINREKNFLSRTKSFISRRLGEPPPAPAMMKRDILSRIRRCVVVKKKWGKPLKIQTKSVPFYQFRLQEMLYIYIWNAQVRSVRALLMRQFQVRTLIHDDYGAGHLRLHATTFV